MRLSPALFALLATLGACDEVRQRPVSPPAGLDAGGDPIRGGPEALVRAFGDRGRGLTGRPAEMALALARLEYLTDAMERERALTAVPPSVRFEMIGARRETRAALGMAETVPPARAVEALLATSRALQRGDDAAANAAIAPVVSPEGLPPLGRLADLGGLPQAAIATTTLRDEIQRLDLENGWGAVPMLNSTGFSGMTTSGLGGNTDR
jgi:hypothetical protein